MTTLFHMSVLDQRHPSKHMGYVDSEKNPGPFKGSLESPCNQYHERLMLDPITHPWPLLNKVPMASICSMNMQYQLSTNESTTHIYLDITLIKTSLLCEEYNVPLYNDHLSKDTSIVSDHQSLKYPSL